jgi:ribosome biogenesis GTPase / thiamine phosphate phosphatase
VHELATLGWDDGWQRALEPFAADGLTPGRVAVQHRGAYDVMTVEGDVRAKVTPRLRRASTVAELPVVGDWVALSGDEIAAVLPRRTAFVRRAAADAESGTAREQVVAANADLVLVTAPLGQDVDRLVLERYVTLALQSGAEPVLLLTKADLVDDPAAAAADLEGVGGEIPIAFVSAKWGTGIERVRELVRPGRTAALLGPSGAGKSTLVNTLTDETLLETADVRADGTGRHTTTRRQLVPIPGGGLLIDNPGMREVHLWLADDGLDAAFPDVTELAASCRFADCSHETEPGCAIQEALAAGTLSRERWDRYRALERELEELAERLRHAKRARERRGRRREG